MYYPDEGIIALNEPLNTRDVGLALGCASDDVGTLCTHPNINMWAKYKSVFISPYKFDKLTEEEIKSVNCGITATAYRSLREIMDAVEIEGTYSGGVRQSAWHYDPVQPPYRLGDFQGYDSKAKCFVEGIYVPDNVSADYVYQFDIGVNPDDIYSVGIGDFKFSPMASLNQNIGDCVVGMLFTRAGQTPKLVCTVDPISNYKDLHTIPVFVNATSLGAGDWKVYPFLISPSTQSITDFRGYQEQVGYSEPIDVSLGYGDFGEIYAYPIPYQSTLVWHLRPTLPADLNWNALKVTNTTQDFDYRQLDFEAYNVSVEHSITDWRCLIFRDYGANGCPTNELPDPSFDQNDYNDLWNRIVGNSSWAGYAHMPVWISDEVITINEFVSGAAIDWYGPIPSDIGDFAHQGSGLADHVYMLIRCTAYFGSLNKEMWTWCKLPINDGM